MDDAEFDWRYAAALARQEDQARHVYFNFPVTMLEYAFRNIELVCTEIIQYAIYARFLTLTEGTIKTKMAAAGKYLGVTPTSSTYQDGKEVYNRYSRKAPIAGIKKSLAFDFRDNKKTEFEIAVFVAYCALRSIIGSKPYIKTSNEYLIARMGGYHSIADMPNELPELLKKFSTRKRLERIKIELQNNWNLSYYSNHTRGFYCSFTLDLTTLIVQAEQKRKNYKAGILQKKKETAYQLAMHQININNLIT